MMKSSYLNGYNDTLSGFRSIVQSGFYNNFIPTGFN